MADVAGVGVTGGDRPLPPPPPAAPEDLGGRRVFISYSSRDVETARAIRGVLEQHGYLTWMAPDSMRGSGTWVEQIMTAVEQCEIMIVLISADSNASDQVAREVGLAVESGTIIIPVRIADVSLARTLKYNLMYNQWVDVFPPPVHRHAQSLIHLIRSAERTASQIVAPLPVRRRGRRIRWALLAGIGALIASVAAVVVVRDDSPDPPSDASSDSVANVGSGSEITPDTTGTNVQSSMSNTSAPSTDTVGSGPETVPESAPASVVAGADPTTDATTPSTTGDSVQDESGGQTFPAPSGAVPAGWTPVVDDTSTIAIAVPDGWTDVDATSLADVLGPGLYLAASPDIDLFIPADGVADTFSVPGVWYRTVAHAADTYTPLIGYESGDCAESGVAAYDDGVFSGHVATLKNCGGTASTVYVIRANTPSDSVHTVELAVQLTGAPDDAATLDGVLSSFNVFAAGLAPRDAVVGKFVAPSGDVPATLTPLVDATRTIAISVPASWIDDSDAPAAGADSNPTLTASTHIDLFLPPDGVADTFGVPGVWYRTIDRVADTQRAVRDVEFDDCIESGIRAYDDGVFSGHAATFTNCGGTSTTIHVVRANAPSDDARTAALLIQLTGAPEDAAALDGLLSSFNVFAAGSAPQHERVGKFPTPSGVVPGGWTQLTDASATISISVPPAWTDITTHAFADMPRISASTDLGAFYSADPVEMMGAAGVLFDAPNQYLPDAAELFEGPVATDSAEECADQNLQAFRTAAFVGFARTMTECRGTATRVVQIAANAIDASSTVYVEVQLTGAPDDAATLDGLLSSFGTPSAAPAETPSTTTATAVATTLPPAQSTTTVVPASEVMVLTGVNTAGERITADYTCTELHDFVVSPARACRADEQTIFNQIIATNQQLQTFVDLGTLGSFSSTPISHESRAWIGLAACVTRAADPAHFATFDEYARRIFPAATPVDSQRMWDEAHRVLCPFLA